MSQKDQEIESAIVTAGANVAPRLTPADIDAVIVSEHYFTAAQGALGAYRANNDIHVGSVPSPASATALPLLTFCVLTLKNGFTVTGESACASPENFNEEIGRKVAYENAREKIWVLEGYLLKQRLHEQTQTAN